MKRLCLAFAGLMVLVSAVKAADMAQPAPAPYYPPAAVYAPPPYSWTGFYFGINGGGGFGGSSWDSSGSRDVSGGLIGAQLGYNYQIGQTVVGVEGDFDATDLNGGGNSNCTAGCKTSNDWLSTVRGRVGYAADRFMPYVTAGAAFGNIKASTAGSQNSSDNVGWTLGGGLETAFAANWTARVEYLYLDLGSFNCGTACNGGASTTDNVSFHANILRAGVNYKF